MAHFQIETVTRYDDEDGEGPAWKAYVSMHGRTWPIEIELPGGPVQHMVGMPAADEYTVHAPFGPVPASGHKGMGLSHVAVAPDGSVRRLNPADGRPLSAQDAELARAMVAAVREIA